MIDSSKCRKTVAILIACILLLISVPSASAILSLRDADLYPSAGYLRPGERVNVSATVEIIPSGATTFASGHTMVLSTDMEEADWDVRVLVDGIQGAVIQKNTDQVFVNGYLLSYPTERDVSVSIAMVGVAPATPESEPFVVLRLAELNNQGIIVGGSETSIQRDTFSSTNPLPEQTDTVTITPGETPTADLPFHMIFGGLFCALLLLKRDF